MCQQYFAFDILLLIGTAIGAYFVFTGDSKSLQKPFVEALKVYNDTSNIPADKTLVKAWSSFQHEVSESIINEQKKIKKSLVFYCLLYFQFQCCGVETYKDWEEYNSLFKGPNQTTNAKPDYSYRLVPESCCKHTSNQTLPSHNQVVHLF